MKTIFYIFTLTITLNAGILEVAGVLNNILGVAASNEDEQTIEIEEPKKVNQKNIDRLNKYNVPIKYKSNFFKDGIPENQYFNKH